MCLQKMLLLPFEFQAQPAADHSPTGSEECRPTAQQDEPDAGFLVVDLVLCSAFALHCKKLLLKNG